MMTSERPVLFAISLAIVCLLFYAAAAEVVAEPLDEATIEQWISESKAAHEAERLAKVGARERQIALASVLGISGALPTQYQYDVSFYDLDLRIDVVEKVIVGRVGMTAVAVQDAVSFCEIDLHSNLAVDSVLVDGNLAVFVHLDDLLTVTLPEAADQGTVFEVNTFYQGHPTGGGLQGFSFGTFGGRPAVSTLSEPYLARSWWPCKDYPDDKADSVDVTVTYADDLFCTSNGVLISDVDNLDGTRTTLWSHRYPIATYLVSLAMSEYEHWREWWRYSAVDSMPVDYWVYPERLGDAQFGWSATRAMLDTLSDRFGLYPFATEKYAMTMFNWGGAMEHQTNTSMGPYTTYQSITVHELAHQWWGDMITCRNWHHIWLNEGFATYTEALWFESLGGMAALQSYMQGIAYHGGGSIYISDTADVGEVFSTRVYHKGAWVLHMLRHLVGDEMFFEILQTYYDHPDFKWGTAITSDFRDLCEEVSGVELSDFFHDWIYGNLYPKYVSSFTYDQLGPDSFRVYLHIRQEQDQGTQVFRIPAVDVAIADGTGWQDFVLPITKRRQDYVLNWFGRGEPLEVGIDPGSWLLREQRSEPYAAHIVFDTLSTGIQYEPYLDSIIVRGGRAPYAFQVPTGVPPSGFRIDNTTGVISGYPSDSGEIRFSVWVTDADGDFVSKVISIYVEPVLFLPGDADGNGILSINDAVYILAYLFGGPAPEPIVAGDVNSDCWVNLVDVYSIVMYIFGNGPPPAVGCIE